jgi:hypothetical protein
MGKIGIEIVHLHEGDKYLTYGHGTLKQGFSRVRKLLEEGNNNGYHIDFHVRGQDSLHYQPTRKYLYGGLPNIDPFEIVAEISNFFRDPVDKEVIDKFDISRLLLAGFNRTACVLALAKRAKKMGITFATSDDLLFGKKSSDDPVETDEALRYFANEGTLYGNHQELISAEILCRRY